MKLIISSFVFCIFYVHTSEYPQNGVTDKDPIFAAYKTLHETESHVDAAPTNITDAQLKDMIRRIIIKKAPPGQRLTYARNFLKWITKTFANYRKHNPISEKESSETNKTQKDAFIEIVSGDKTLDETLKTGHPIDINEIIRELENATAEVLDSTRRKYLDVFKYVIKMTTSTPATVSTTVKYVRSNDTVETDNHALKYNILKNLRSINSLLVRPNENKSSYFNYDLLSVLRRIAASLENFNKLFIRFTEPKRNRTSKLRRKRQLSMELVHNGQRNVATCKISRRKMDNRRKRSKTEMKRTVVSKDSKLSKSNDNSHKFDSIETKKKLLKFVEEDIKEIKSKLVVVHNLRDTFEDNINFQIGYVIATIDVMELNIDKIKSELDKHKDIWDSAKTLDIFDKVKYEGGIIYDLLVLLQHDLSKIERKKTKKSERNFFPL